MNTPSPIKSSLSVLILGLVLVLTSNLVTTVAFAAGNADLKYYGKCREEAAKAIKGCNQAEENAKSGSNAASEVAGGTVPSGGSVAPGASAQKGAAEKSAVAYAGQVPVCERAAKGCDKCDSNKVDTPELKEAVDREKKTCTDQTKEIRNRLASGAQAFKQIADGSEKTRKEGGQQGGGQQGQQGQEQGQGQQGDGGGKSSPSSGSSPQNSKNDDSKTQEPSSNSASAQEQKGIQPDGKSPLAEAAKAADCSGANGKMTDEQRKQCSAGFLNPDGTCKPGTGTRQCSVAKVNDFCAKGNNSCPSCKGMTAQALSSASTNDLKSMCSGSCAGDPALGPNLADACRKVEAAKLSPESLKAATGAAGFSSAGGGSSGGGSTAAGAGHGAQPQSLLDADKIKIQDLQGSREGGPNLAGQVDGGGGFGGYGASGGGNLPSEDDLDRNRFRSQSAGGNSAGRGPSSSGPVSAAAKDIENQFGHNVIRIVSEVLRNHCAQGRFMHCEQGR